ncbi:hypothetical protein C7212DRAFT_214073 [Tuber magnatum]|uniref:Cation-transporting P-type ATPase N-terminal domain-containing protein n=1 Tax=Tuber magnatum TaxID=42249 RepID=A0A317SHN6_9PEZI|nr:hypothetical protein C7212DRAFT_214073 [Tuber magnatum]
MQNDGEDIHSRSREGPMHNGLSNDPYLLSGDEVVRQLSTDPDDGLSDAEAAARMTKFGLNELDTGAGVSVVRILLGQLFNAMGLVLIMAMVVSFAIQSWIEAAVITAVVIVNIIVGFLQEYSAEKTMDSLRSLSSPTASVIRSGQSKTVCSVDIVPGDVIEVKTGDTIPADVRLIEAMNKSYHLRLTPFAHFETDEALLTGESLPVAKVANATFKGGEDVGVGDRINMAYSSSTVSKGRAKAVVVTTGMQTEIGKIAQSLRGDKSRVRKVRRDEEGNAGVHRYLQAGALTATDQVGNFLGVSVGTPLQRKLSWLAIFLFLIAVLFAIICLAANGFSNRQEVVLYAVA